ncbi:hypothetical protein BDW59DRAFT_161907 [Aspergillus cavernicola]|uniref:DUF7732 domain-containing protein n=1 Tax=Aspergillus cavernicola TaxID=176166 RepID=A0ABR4IE61_9EURO
MAFRSSLLTLLAAVFLCLGVCTGLNVGTRRDLHSKTSLSSVSRSIDTVEAFWKRRVHHDSDSDTDTDSTSDSTSNSQSSSNTADNDDNDGTSQTSTSTTCVRQRNTTRILHNDDGYGHYYSSGIGSENSTAGGTTPDGSGTEPRFDNSTGAWVTLEDGAANDIDIDDQHYLSYLGGAAVPYKSGDNSPNGLSPKRLDNLAFTTVGEDSITDGSCAVPNSSFAYQYESQYSLSSGNVPVYCTCAPYGLCGCDDFHANSSFVPAVLSYLGLGTEAKNISKLCTVSLESTTTILVDGGLSNGSTKADPDAKSVITRVPRSRSTRCPSSGSGGGGSAAPVSLSVNNGLLVAWTGTLSLGMAFGMSLVWL